MTTFDYETCESLLRDGTEKVKQFAINACWLNDDNARQAAVIADLQRVLAWREAETVMLQRALLEAEGKCPKP